MTSRRCLLLLIPLLAAGCGPEQVTFPEKAPLPVSVMQLRPSIPPRSRPVTGSVRSWKTEDMTFEVSGRVEWVIEPGTEIEGRSYGADGQLLSPGTQIAQLDEERFVSAVDTAQGDVNIAMLTRDSVKVQIDRALPAEFKSATAQRDLAQVDFDRNKRLVAQNAGPKANLDKAKAALDSANSQLDALNANMERGQADLKSAEAKVVQAQQSLKDAERNLADTRLYSSFRGQISEVHVVPGSIASPQSRVATVQMMSPIKVELEVSADVSRTIRLNDAVPVRVMTQEGQTRQLQASVYSIAPSADNATRTFTLTLLAPNPKVVPSVTGHDQLPKARTSFIWRMGIDLLPDRPDGTWYMPESGLHQDENGSFIWKVTNFKAKERVKRVLEVAKLRVTTGNVSVPFLGKTRFQTISIDEGQPFDSESDLFATDILIGGVPVDDWSGDEVLLDAGERWLLRPGDIVDVDLSPIPTQSGFYVPAKAVHEESGETSIFVIESSGEITTAHKIAVRLVGDESAPVSSLQRIEPKDESVALDGKRIVLEGVHYLADGQTVSVTDVAEGRE